MTRERVAQIKKHKHHSPKIQELCDSHEKFREALVELVEVATLRNDNDLPHPVDDDLLWTARMQTAWDDAEELIESTEAK